MPEQVELPVGRLHQVKSLCGARVFGEPQTDWAAKLIAKGVPHCKKCERIIERGT